MLGYFPGLQPDESGRKIVGPTAKGSIVLMRLCRPLHRRLKKCDSKFDGPANDIRYIKRENRSNFSTANRSRVRSDCLIRLRDGVPTRLCARQVALVRP